MPEPSVEEPSLPLGEASLPGLVLPVLPVPSPVPVPELPLDVVGACVDGTVLELHVGAEVAVVELDELVGAVLLVEGGVAAVVVVVELLEVVALPLAAGGAVVAVVQLPLVDVSSLVTVVAAAVEDPDSARRFASFFRALRGRAAPAEPGFRVIVVAPVPAGSAASAALLKSDWTAVA